MNLRNLLLAVFLVLGLAVPGGYALSAHASTSGCFALGPTCGNNVNAFGNGWSAKGHLASQDNPILAQPAASNTDPALDWIRTGTGPFRFEFAPNGKHSGYCASDPGDHLVRERHCNTGNWQRWRVGPAGSGGTKLVNVATGLAVTTQGTGNQLITGGSYTAGAYWTWKGGPVVTPTPTPTTPTPTPTTSSPSPTPTNTPYTVTAWLSTYDWWNNSPPGCGISYAKSYGYPTVHDCAGGSVNNTIGAVGTYDDPITFAAQNSGVFNLAPGTRIYIEKLGNVTLDKYFMLEDLCATCYTDKAQADLWVGGVDQTQEADTSPSNIVNLWEQDSVIVNPANNLPVDTTPLKDVHPGQATPTPTPTPTTPSPTPTPTTPTPSPTPTALTLSGSNVAELQGNKYHLQANEWDSTAPFTITSDGSPDFKIATSGINNSTSGAPGAYPSLYKGCHWGYCTSGSGLPVTVAAMQTPGMVSTSFDTTTTGIGGAWDDAYDVWFNPASSTTNNSSGLEMMIWLRKNGTIQPAGSKVASAVNIGGVSYDVWHGGSSPGGTVSYVMTSPTDKVTNLDLGPLAADSAARGYLTNAWSLIDVEAGFEPWVGGQGLTANSFGLCVNGSC